MMNPNLRQRVWLWHKLRKFCNGPPSSVFNATPNDVFVLPEFIYPLCMRGLGTANYVLVAQDVFGFTRAFVKDIESGTPRYPSLNAILTTSAASNEATSMFLERHCHRLQLPVASEKLRYKAEKKLQIAYMPRKRKEEAGLVVAALRTRFGLKDIPIISIQGVSNDERNRIMSESLIFLSFSEQEGFGLPPAEAMATGCIVIGYTGVGGNEYFSTETGFPIEDNDILTFVQTVEQVVSQFRTSPQSLTRIRRHAANKIAKEYGEANARSIALAVWKQIDEEIKSCRTARASTVFES